MKYREIMAEADEPQRFRFRGETIQLLKVSDVPFWYHGTCDNRLPGIMEHGLLANIPDRAYAWVDEYGVFLGVPPERVAQYAQRSAQIYKGNPMILKIDAKQLDPEQFDGDRDYYYGLKQFHKRFCAKKIAGSENIECDNADLSLTMLHSVVYMSDIPPSAVTVYK